MDNTFNQSDLQNLKQRVSQLSSKYSPGPPGMFAPSWSSFTHHDPGFTYGQDPFMEQMEGLVKRVKALEQSMVNHQTLVATGTSLPALSATATLAEAFDAGAGAGKDVSAERVKPSYGHAKFACGAAIDEVKGRLAKLEKNQERDSSHGEAFAERLEDVEQMARYARDSLGLYSHKLDSFSPEHREVIESTQEATEKRLDELEDRLDRMDPDRFTPASSATGTETGLRFGSPKIAESSQGAEPVCELYEDGKQVHSHGPCLSAEMASEAVPSRSLPSFKSMFSGRPNTFNLPTTFEWGNGYAQPEAPYPVASPACTAGYPLPPQYNASEADVRYSIDRLHHQNDFMSEHINKLDQENVRLLHMIQDMQRRSHQAPTNDSERLARPGVPTFVSPGGVDFRDREIARLDEQLKMAHEQVKITEESLKASEDNIALKDVKILDLEDMTRRLKDGMIYRAESCHELRKQLAEADMRIDDRERQVVDLQRLVTDRDHAIRSWSDSWQQKDDEVRHWRRNAADDEEYVRDTKAAKYALVDSVSREYEDEITKVKEFSEKKDGVIEQMKEFLAKKDEMIQKQIMNAEWARELMEQKDRELDRMDQKVRQAEENQSRLTRAEFDRLLRKGNAETADLKRGRSDDDVSQGGSWYVGSRGRSFWDDEFAKLQRGDNDRRQDEEHASSRADNGLLASPPRSTAGSWRTATDDRQVPIMNHMVEVTEQAPAPPPRPQPVRPQRSVDGDDKAEEQRSPFVWNNDANGFVRQESDNGSVVAQQGGVSPVVEKKRRGKHAGRHRRALPVRLYEEPDKRSTSPFSTATTRGWDTDRRAERRAYSPPARPRVVVDASPVRAGPRISFVDEDYDRPYSPPLPAPVTARRMASEADLRSTHYPGGRTAKRNNLQKHRSMMDLPQRKSQTYQASVETEAESEE